MKQRLVMAFRMVRRADDVGSRVRLMRYFVINAISRRRRRGTAMRSELAFRLGGIQWTVNTGSSQLGGVHDVWTAHEYDAFEGFVASPGSVVVDIGANVGAYTLWQALHMARQGLVIAVEASPGTLAVLRGNIERNGFSDTVELVESAVWSERGTVDFTVSDRSSSTSGVTASLDMSLVQDASSVTVPAMTLDDLLDGDRLRGARIDVLKLDVEGAELEVLRAASAAVLRRIDRLVVEADERTWPGVRALLESNGMECVGRHRMVGYFRAHPQRA